MKLLATTTLALGLAAAGAASAETHAMTPMTSADMMENRAELIRSRDITGGAIYAFSEGMSEGFDEASIYEEVGGDWNEIGEIEDVILSRDGQMIGVVGEVGGFLDIADKHVMIPVEDVRLVAVDDRSYAIVTRMTEEQLEELQGVDEGFWN
ncbi:PRC-barrel domain-containing protein [Profundibacterium mesophilum]|uniref:Nucleoside-binding outer membrane protein Cell envelope biogenesis n=1 Tax=Profundibacterium mesophilum KAUST100406-0324 TaxID=1037889 RepID=A0A921NVD9_9RHOB|nr:PRC-barrel domain-containing protein [Profundibacterium mesophilum]KAF0676210.1 Nucleoside-binding outer membrane protein Cell envelope biogenesis [Profundibacterium mesophilum KAUST100406-0324]